MKDRIQQFVALPFSLGCSTQSSVAVADTHDQPKKPDQLIKRREESDENGLFQKEDTSIDNNNNNGSANISDKIIRSFKSYEEEREEREAEMEIGFPTDVKHLSHIGVDGTMTTFDVYSTTNSSSFPFAGFHLTALLKKTGWFDLLRIYLGHTRKFVDARVYDSNIRFCSFLSASRHRFVDPTFKKCEKVSNPWLEPESEALAPRLPLRVLNLCDTSATPLCLWVPHLHKLFASKRFCSSSSSPELCLHRLYALPSDLRLRSMPLLNLRTGGVFLGEPVMEIYPEADTQN
ncbi:hypothetical protein YC2023_083429 [Brassica napus]